MRGGQTVIAGTHGPLRTVLASLAEGAGLDDILADHPALSKDNVSAVIAFAAASAEEDLPVPAVPQTRWGSGWTRTCRSVWRSF